MRVRLAAATAVCDSLESPQIETPLVTRFPPRNRCEGQHFSVERSSSVTADVPYPALVSHRFRASCAAPFFAALIGHQVLKQKLLILMNSIDYILY